MSSGTRFDWPHQSMCRALLRGFCKRRHRMPQSVRPLSGYCDTFRNRWQCQCDRRDARTIRDRNNLRTTAGSVRKRSTAGGEKDARARVAAAGTSGSQCHSQRHWQRAARGSRLYVSECLGQRRGRIAYYDPPPLRLCYCSVGCRHGEVAETWHIACIYGDLALLRGTNRRSG